MDKYFGELLKRLLIVAGLLSCLFSNSQNQSELIKEAKDLPLVNTRATLSGFPNVHAKSIPKDSIKNGFRVVLGDPSYKIESFLVSYLGDDCDIVEIMVYGDSVSVSKLPLLKTMRRSGLFFLSHFKVVRGHKNFTIPEIYFIAVE